jgi:ketosteroid isomerase-like protein
MSQENVEIVRAVYERFRDGDFRASAELLDPYVVLVLGAGFGPDSPSATHFGAEAVSAYTRALLETWEDFTMEASEIVAAGDSVLAEVCQRGIGRTSGAPTEMHYFTLWSFRGATVIRIQSFRERSAALEAAGLRE